MILMTGALCAACGETSKEDQPDTQTSDKIDVEITYAIEIKNKNTSNVRLVSEGQGEPLDIERLALSSFSAELIPCEETASHNQTRQDIKQETRPTVIPSVFSLVDSTALTLQTLFSIPEVHAGHSTDASSPWQTTTGIQEELLSTSAQTQLIWETLHTTILSPQRFCHVHYLVARTDERFPDISPDDPPRTSLITHGTRGTDQYISHSAINYGRLLVLDPPLSLNATSPSATILLTHDLDAALAATTLPLNGGAIDDDELSRRLIRALVTHTSATVVPEG